MCVCVCVCCVMCGCLNNYVGVLVICVFVFTMFCNVCTVLLYYIILMYIVCTSVRATATERKLNCSSSNNTYCFHLLLAMKMKTTLFCTTCMRRIKLKTIKHLYTHVYNAQYSNLSAHELSANCSSSCLSQNNYCS